MARKVHRVHGDKDQVMFDGILKTFLAVRADIEPHLKTEEETLFPMILEGKTPGEVLDIIEDDHVKLGQLLATMRSLTKDFFYARGSLQHLACTSRWLEDLGS